MVIILKILHKRNKIGGQWIRKSHSIFRMASLAKTGGESTIHVSRRNKKRFSSFSKKFDKISISNQFLIIKHKMSTELTHTQRLTVMPYILTSRIRKATNGISEDISRRV